MLTADYLDVLPGPIIALYQEYEEAVILDIVRRIARLGKITSASAWQAQRLIDSGLVYESILERLAELTGKSEKELAVMFRRAGVKAMRFDDSIYRAAGLSPLPLNLSPAMGEVLAAGLRKTGGIMRNLTMTTAISGQRAFEHAADLAYMQISSGAFDYNTAIRFAVRKVAEDGLTVVNYANGRVDQLDVAMRRTVLTGVNQTVGILQERRADEMGQDLVQTSAHIGARNTGVGPANHEGWQGKIFSRSGTSKEYPDFVTETGYGTVTGLYGVNCRHSHFPFFEGISQIAYNQATLDSFANKTVAWRGNTISVYDATQEQRSIERRIRHWKRQANAMEAAGMDASRELAKVKTWQARMRVFLKETGMDRQRVREQI